MFFIVANYLDTTLAICWVAVVVSLLLYIVVFFTTVRKLGEMTLSTVRGLAFLITVLASFVQIILSVGSAIAGSFTGFSFLLLPICFVLIAAGMILQNDPHHPWAVSVRCGWASIVIGAIVAIAYSFHLIIGSSWQFNLARFTS